MNDWTTIEELFDRHLGSRPSPAVLTQMKKVEKERPEVRRVVELMFRLMEISRVDPKDILPVQAWAIGVALPGFLPDAWGGSVPPFTLENRHKRIDEYLRKTPWGSFGAGTKLLEMGCGFPPQTACDAARFHPDWRITGADPAFDEYLLYDRHGSYACLNASGELRYFHPASGNDRTFRALYEDKPATIRHFSELFQKLAPQLPPSSDGEMASAESDGARLIRNPLRVYEAANLKLVQAGIGAEFAAMDIIRCFNVFSYFDAKFRRDAENWALRTLCPGGLFVCGHDFAYTTEARYTVYRNEDGRLAAKEFAFSIDTVRNFTIAPWFSLHENGSDSWTRAKLTGLLCADDEFRSIYDARYDALIAEKRLYFRDADGCMATAPDQLPQSEWFNAQEEIQLALEREGFAERAVAVLRKSDLRAWVNEVGHVAVDPATFGENAK